MTRDRFLTIVPRLYRRGNPHLGLAYHFTRDMDDAEDIISDSVVKALSRLDTLDGEFDPWFYTVVLNTARDWMKNRRNHHERLQGEPVSHYVDPLQEVIDTETRTDIARALVNIPVHHRDAIIGKFVRGERHEHLAERAGLSVAAMKMRLHRARQLMQEQLYDVS